LLEETATLHDAVPARDYEKATRLLKNGLEVHKKIKQAELL